MSDAVVATAPHETRGSIAWTDHGDAPYWAAVALYRAADGGGTYTLEVDGEELEVSLGYDKEGISPRPSDTVERITHVKVFWQYPDGRKLGGFIKPIFEADEFRKYEPGKAFERREKIAVPDDLGEATRFQIVAGKYAEPREYREKLPVVLEALAREIGVGWNTDYLSGHPHPYSTITTHARTVRIGREFGRKLVRADGVLKRIGQVLVNGGDVEGSRIVYDEDHREGRDWRHSVSLNADAADRLLPTRVPGVELKVYHPEHIRGEHHKDDPLYHPRAEVIFKKALNGHGWPFDDVEALVTRLEELLLNVLLWGGVPIEPATPPYVPDDYQDVEATDRPIRLFDDPTPQLERDQQGDLVRVIARASGQDVDRLGELLAADGGQPAHHHDVEERLDVSTSTFYRFVDRMGGLLESDNGVLKFVSERQRQLALDVLEPLRAEVDSRARAIAKLVDLNPMLLAKKGSAFQRWLIEYAVDVEASDDGRLRRLKIDAVLDRLKSTARPRLDDVLEEGFKAWREIGLDSREFLETYVEYRAPDGSRAHARTAAVI